MRVLITGANGFLGSHLVERSLLKGYQVTTLLRKGANLSNIQHLSGFDTVQIDYSSIESIKMALDNLGDFDLIIHNAGLTKSYTLDNYLKVNVILTNNLIAAIKEKGILKPEGVFAYISSLAAKGPVGNNGPASNYGRSKLIAEDNIQKSGINFMIFRPAGIYGSRDVQFVPLIKAVKLGIYPLMTSANHKMTLINAKDVADNVIDCSMTHSNKIVHMEDGQVYMHKDLKQVLENVLNRKSGNLKVPKSIVKFLLSISDIINRNLNRTPELSLEHYSEISQNWDYDFSAERGNVPLKINYPLENGFKEALNYYHENNLI